MMQRPLPNLQSCLPGTGSLLYLLLVLLLTACTAQPAGLSRPNGMAVAPDGSLYVMDRGNYRVVHLSATGDFLSQFGQLGTGPGNIYSGWDIDLDSAGNIYVCNLVLSPGGAYVIHDGVKVFAPDGRFIRELGGHDYPLNNTAPRYNPYGLAIDSQDRIYVADFGTNTVRIFDQAGQQLAILFGIIGVEDGQFKGLVDVAVDDRRGLLYVLDQFNSRVQQFALHEDASGEITVTHQYTLGSYGRQPGQFAYPQSMALTEQRLHISDMANRRIQVFDPEGRPVLQMTAPQDWQALGLDVGPDGAVYSIDALNNLIWIFEPDGQIRGQLKVGS